MPRNTISVFDSAVADAHEWLNAIRDALDYDDAHFALQALRGVLHALRDRLMIDQSAHLSAQLPLLIRGLYFENWDPEPLPSRDRSLDGFLDRVRVSMAGYRDGAPGLSETVEAVFATLRRHISWGEDEKVGKALPHEIAALWNFEGAM
jgi:uncharacterized protein (DUF2267 family)